MVKGVIFGVLACVTILPSMILCCDKLIVKTKHKPFLPDIGKLSDKVTKRYLVYVVIFLVLLFPAIYGNNHTSVYYNLDETLPKDLPSIIANEKLKEDYDMNTTHMILVDSSTESADVAKLLNKMEKVDGVKWALGLDSLIGPAIPQSMIPESVTAQNHGRQNGNARQHSKNNTFYHDHSDIHSQSKCHKAQCNKSRYRRNRTSDN